MTDAVPPKEPDWRWPIMVTYKYDDTAEDVIVLFAPESDERGQRPPPRFLAWEELGFEEAIDWILESVAVPGDLTEVIAKLTHKQAVLQQGDTEKGEERTPEMRTNGG